MARKISEGHSEGRARETDLKEIIRDYLGSADPGLEKRILSLVDEILRKSRPFNEIAKDLLRERCRQYDLDVRLINDRMVQQVQMSLMALNSYTENTVRREGKREEKLVEIRKKIRDTLSYIDDLILGK